MAAQRAPDLTPDDITPQDGGTDAQDAPANNGAIKAMPVLIPQKHGGALNSGGTPGNKGGTGRPRRAFKEFAADLANDPELQESVRKRAHKQATVLKMVLDHGAGVPEQKVTLVHDTGALDRLFARLAPDPRTLPDATVSELAPPQAAPIGLGDRIPSDPASGDHA